MLQLGICEIYTPFIHGLTNHSSRDIIGNFMITDLIYLNEFYDFSYINMINTAKCKWVNVVEIGMINRGYKHPIIKNLKSIIERGLFINLDIVDVKTLENGEMVGIKKTFWLKIIQRLYKKVYRERKKIIYLRKTPRALYYRRANGVWPKYCVRLPVYKFN